MELEKEVEELKRRVEALESLLIGREDRVAVAQKFSDVFKMYAMKFPKRASRIQELLRGEKG